MSAFGPGASGELRTTDYQSIVEEFPGALYVDPQKGGNPNLRAPLPRVGNSRFQLETNSFALPRRKKMLIASAMLLTRPVFRLFRFFNFNPLLQSPSPPCFRCFKKARRQSGRVDWPAASGGHVASLYLQRGIGNPPCLLKGQCVHV